MERFIEKDGKKLRYGFTTGTSAAAAAKAAAFMLSNNVEIDSIEIDTPKGWILEIPIIEIEKTDEYVKCGVVKDAGDDPDVTHGMKFYAKVSWADEYSIAGGIGIGQVTKPGMQIPVGEPAINPVPRKMIYNGVHEVIPKGKTVSVEISAPKGVERCKRTFNPKLGIVGGISIIGTSGIVEPMSEDALKDTMKIELKMQLASGYTDVIFSPGNFGRDFAVANGFSAERLVKTSNFIGFMMDEAERQEVKNILWVGHLGKMVKVAGGIFQTHSSYSDGRMEVLTANLALMDAPQELCKQVMDSNTTDEAVEYIKEFGYEEVFNHLANKVSKRCRDRAHESVNVATIIFTKTHGFLGQCDNAEKMKEVFGG